MTTDVYNLTMLDVTEPEVVEISIAQQPRGTTVWINVNGKCLLRCNVVGSVVIDDRRPLAYPTPKNFGGKPDEEMMKE